MTRQSLAAAAKLLYGAQWQRPLSRSLCVDNRLVRRWYSGDRPIPSWVEPAVLKLLEARAQAINNLLADD